MHPTSGNALVSRSACHGPLRWRGLGATLAVFCFAALALIAAVAVIGPRVVARRIFETILSSDYARFRSVKPGWTDAQVRATLGKPYRTCRPAGPTPCYIPGWARPRRAITGTVYVYLGSEPIAYVFMGADGRVDEVFVGGS
jgi:hypothetical protein